MWAVEPDHILYENLLHKARTLWLHRTESGALNVRMVDGFQAFAPEDWGE